MLKKLLFPCLVLFFALSLVDAKPPTMPKDDGWWLKGKSVILKSSNFDEFVRTEPNVIVEFITSFSTDSQKMSDEWNKLAEMYLGANPKRTDVKVAIIDGWTFSTVSHEYGVKVFPQILLFTGNSKEAKARYEGERTAEKISEWAEAQIALAKTETIQAVDDTVATSDAVTDAPTSADAASTTGTQTQTDQAAAPVETKPPVDNAAATNQQQQQQPPQQAQQAQQTQQPPQQAQQAQQPTQQAQQTQQTQEQQQQPPKPQTPPPTQQQQQQQQQQPAKPQTPPPQQQQKEENSAPVVKEDKKEVKVVLNTTLLQSQFESLQKHFDAVTDNLKANINDNVNKISELRTLLDTQRQEMANLHLSLRGQTQKFDELKQVLLTNKQEVQQSVTGHTEKHLEEVKGALHQIKGKVFEAKPTESKGFGSGILYLLIGGVVGGAVTFVLLNMSRNNKKRKLLID